ncbi:PREDICTED: epigen isoform X2 [Elephantulus edwardii]|uniref:epigen isoform X2 n=1 Tax=Elephantulus edwardii TaxID=28737 RepID=UPI0003F08136|nr:PREDICTED: epigen isoform X2 [Elephantulus edwardii]
MAFGVLISVYLLFNAMAAFTEEASITVTPPITTQLSNWTVNKTEADATERPITLKFSPPCLEDHNSYCINGVCTFHQELEKAICRCLTGYTGERCECLKLKSPYSVCSGRRPL